MDPGEKSLEEYQIEGRGFRLHGRLDAAQTFHPRLFPGLEIELAQLFRP